MKYILVITCLTIYSLVHAQIPLDLSGFDKKGSVKIIRNENLLEVTWPTGETAQGKFVIDLEKKHPLFNSIQISDGSNFTEIAKAIDPAFLLTVGKRDLVKQNGWNIFFDQTAYLPHQTYNVILEKQSAKVVSAGSQTQIIIASVKAGQFSGTLEITLFKGSPLIDIAAVLSTPVDSLAIIYDAGLISKTDDWKNIFWADTQDYLQSVPVNSQDAAKPVAVKYRTIIAQSTGGSIALFPAPHQYFYPLDNAYNLQHTWYGNNYRNTLNGYGIGIRHDLLGDRRWVPWFNAPPNSKQHLHFFCLLSIEKDGKILEKVKQFTHQDSYQPLQGYYTMSSHFHTEHIDDVLTHKPLPQIPGFVKAFRDTGVNIVHLGEFHGPGSPKGPEVKRFSELKLLFEECERLSGGNFLLLPGEEPNNFLGGHWMNIFPKAVYWVMARSSGQPFVEQDSVYGKVYRIGSKEDMLKLLEAEKGLAWTAHARTKGSTGFPDQYKDEKFYHSDRFFGAAWKAMPADLSQHKLGKRVLDVMDDMANWGQKKYVIAEADLFKIEPNYELYGHLNVNYLQMEKLPGFKEGWQAVLDAMEKGKFFVTTGEVLLPGFTVNGKGSGETLKLPAGGKATIILEASWTFPLQVAEVISGDGKEVYRKMINLTHTEAFGKKTYKFDLNLKNRKWVRVEVWDVAANGAFTQCVWLE
ncbi:hypothetical protein GXP67_05975 [Rhodocytophaga rosea]|uniref:Uncharacterized protein n=1 Tax=Rhodocytophaga rosea TaxID=2704465 RepID=A0A6C0GE66_9BACT|nr:hypothetical protein [Rhodocytophaga rosea]QHT66238.1 hypothetical protein GXP67_05975 [Rhodocytophaga rosea]